MLVHATLRIRSRAVRPVPTAYGLYPALRPIPRQLTEYYVTKLQLTDDRTWSSSSNRKASLNLRRGPLSPTMAHTGYYKNVVWEQRTGTKQTTNEISATTHYAAVYYYYCTKLPDRLPEVKIYKCTSIRTLPIHLPMRPVSRSTKILSSKENSTTLHSYTSFFQLFFRFLRERYMFL